MAARPISSYRRSPLLFISPLYQRPSHDSTVLDHSIKGVAATFVFFSHCICFFFFPGLVASRSMQKQSACDENFRGHGDLGVLFFHVVFLAFWRSSVATAGSARLVFAEADFHSLIDDPSVFSFLFSAVSYTRTLVSGNHRAFSPTLLSRFLGLGGSFEIHFYLRHRYTSGSLFTSP